MILIIVCLALTASTNANPGERFLREYPTQVVNLRARLEGVKGTAKLYGVRDGKSGPPRPIRFATRPGAAKYEFEASDGVPALNGPGEAVVYCRVGRHCFRLIKEEGKPQYVVTMYGDEAIENALFHHDFARYVEAPWSIGNMTILEMLKRPRFKILEAREVEEGGRSLVEVVFETGKSADKMTKVRAAFDPGLSWAIVRAESSYPQMKDRLLRSDVEYTPSSDNRFFVSSVRYRDLDYRTYRCDFPKVDFVDVPESEFTMAHYGLKDPAVKPSGRPTWIYWLAGFLGFAALALLGRWLRRLAS